MRDSLRVRARALGYDEKQIRTVWGARLDIVLAKLRTIKRQSLREMDRFLFGSDQNDEPFA